MIYQAALTRATYLRIRTKTAPISPIYPQTLKRKCKEKTRKGMRVRARKSQEITYALRADHRCHNTSSGLATKMEE